MTTLIRADRLIDGTGADPIENPLVVIEELDRKKARPDEVGANARAALRLLETMGASKNGGLREPARLPAGGSLRIELNGTTSARLPGVLDPSTTDHRILATCLNLTDTGRAPVLVTKDAALRIKGAQLGVAVEDYRGDTVEVDESYSGVREVEVDTDVIDEIQILQNELEIDTLPPKQLCIPVRFKIRTIGVINLFVEDEIDITEELAYLLLSLGAHLGEFFDR